MILKILSIADALVGIIILILHHNFLPWNIGVAAAFYLIIKFYMFRSDIMSLIDLFLGIYIILLMFGVQTFLSYIFALYFFQKAFFGLIK